MEAKLNPHLIYKNFFERGDCMKLRGYIKSYEDALLIAYAVHFGLIEPAKERLLTWESNYLKSGDIFVFVEKMNFRRWIDCRKWSPSRTFLNDFLVYKEITDKEEEDYMTFRKITITITINGIKYHIINYFVNILYTIPVSTQAFFKDLKVRLLTKNFKNMKSYDQFNSNYIYKRLTNNELIEIFLELINSFK